MLMNLMMEIMQKCRLNLCKLSRNTAIYGLFHFSIHRIIRKFAQI